MSEKAAAASTASGPHSKTQNLSAHILRDGKDIWVRSKKPFPIKVDHVIGVFCDPDLSFPRYLTRKLA